MKKIISLIGCLTIASSLYATEMQPMHDMSKMKPGEVMVVDNMPKMDMNQMHEQCKNKMKNGENLTQEEVNYLKYMIYKDKIKESHSDKRISKENYMLNRDKYEGFRDDFREEMRNDRMEQMRDQMRNMRGQEYGRGNSRDYQREQEASEYIYK